MTTIQVNPEELKQIGQSINMKAERLSEIADELLATAESAPSYGGQFRPRVINIGYEHRSLAKERARRLSEMAEKLKQYAAAFAAADEAQLAGYGEIGDVMTELADASLEVPPMPLWIRYQTCPNWVDIHIWQQDYTGDFRKNILKLGEAYWTCLLRHSKEMGGIDQAVLEETHKLLMLAHLGDDINGRRTYSTMLGGDYGKGKKGSWEEHTDPEKGDDPAQYLDVNELAEFGRYWPRYHFNLCGELAVIAALDLDLKEGLLLFKKVNGYEPLNADGTKWGSISGEDILNDRNKTTSGYTLANFFEKASGGALEASFKAGNIKAEEMANMLNEGKSLVALVNIDGNQDGRLDALDQSGDAIAHWVTVLDVVEPPEGPALVRVYNPYMNREEVYTWDTFQDGWAHTEGNTTQYGLVVAEPALGE
jgi:hypothetical protein